MSALTTTDAVPVFPPAGVAKSWCYFLSVSVENLRCFDKEQTLDLSDQRSPGAPARWTIILGENGSGKSTLLQSISLSRPRSWSDPSDPGYSFQIAPAKAWRRHELLSKDNATPIHISTSIATWHDETDGTERASYSLASNQAWVGKRGESERFDAFLPPTPCFAYGSHRHRVGVSVGTSEDWGEGNETLFSNDALLRDPTDIMVEKALAGSLQDPDGASDSPDAMDDATKLASMLASVLPDIDRVRIEMRRGRAAVLFDSPFGRVHFSQLSDGYKATAAWVADLFARMYEAYPRSEDPLKEPAIVLVDEFDLHMHPRWQRDMIAFLTERFPATQFIVTAHGPLIVQSAPDANVVVLRREGDHVVIDNDPPDVSGWRVDQILTSELFGLESARSTQIQAALDERRALVSRDDLSDEEKARLSPKKEVTEDPTHPGYWWLAYEWDNLLLSCAECNRTGNKGNHFPVAATRTNDPGGDLDAEAPLLINPVDEDPADHVTFSGATIVAKTTRGQTTIDTMGLNRSDLSEARSRKYERFRALYRLLEDSTSRGGVGTASWDESWDQLRKALLSNPKEPYKAMMRKAFRDAFDATV